MIEESYVSFETAKMLKEPELLTECTAEALLADAKKDAHDEQEID